MTRKARVLSIEEARRMACEQGLCPGRARKTKDIELTRSGNPNVEVIGWSEFEKIMVTRGISITESSGYLRLVKPIGA